MASSDLSWIVNAGKLAGQGFEHFQVELAKYNGRQLEPGFPTEAWREDLEDYGRVKRAEGEYIEAVRAEVAPWLLTSHVTSTALSIGSRTSKRPGPARATRSFLGWPRAAGRDEMLWFLTQEVAGEAGFDDLLALTQVNMPRDRQIGDGTKLLG